MSEEQLLLDAIRADPGQLDNYLVYGDWLAERGDPRGELIGFQHALAQHPGDATLAARVDTLIAAQLATLPHEVEATWKLGFISELRLDGDADLRALFAHPLVQLVESISVIDRADTGRTLTHERALVGSILTAAPRAMLRCLEIGGLQSSLFDTAGDLQRILARFPRLDELALHTDGLPAGCIELLAPRLRSFELANSQANAEKLMREIAAASWPHLRRLVLSFGWRERENRPSPLKKMMTGHGFPALVDLRVREQPRAGVLTDRFCSEILQAPLLARLEILDFTVSGLDLDAVRPSYPRLRHLKTLLPSAEQETSVAELQRIAYLLEEPDPERAIRLTRATLAHAKTPFDRHNIYRRLGTCLNVVSRVDEALEAFEASLADDPACGVSWMHKAWALKRLGRLDEAADALTRATTTTSHPANRSRVDYLVASLAIARGGGHPTDALEATRAQYATELETSVVDADMFYEHACVLALLGDANAALASLASCFELCPPYKVWARSEIDFATVRESDAFRTLVA